MRSTTGGSPWQNEKKNIPSHTWDGNELLKYRCHNCSHVQERGSVGHVINGDSWAFPCKECGAMLGPGGDHPGRTRYSCSPKQHRPVKTSSLRFLHQMSTGV